MRALVVGGGAMAAGIAACLAAAGIDTMVQVRRASVVDEVRAEIARRGAGRPVSVVAGEPSGPFTIAVESIAEDAGAKRDVLARAEALLAEDGIVTTNTSSLRLADLAGGLARPERFAGWHWFNPAELVPLVEVVGGPQTAPETLERLTALSARIGKRPVTVRRDVPGFIANRLQYALLREAYALVEAGVCDVADVDRAVVDGLGPRWAAIGPFTTMDAAGLDVHEAVVEQLFPVLSRQADVPDLLRQARERGETGMKGGAGLRGAYGPDAVRELTRRRDAILALLSGTLFSGIPPNETPPNEALLNEKGGSR